MNYTLAEQVRDNLRNLILTNWGERLGFYDFGANLRPLTTEYVSQDGFDSQAIERISGTVNRWMPYVSLEDYASTVESSENNNLSIIKLAITYSIPALNVQKHVLEVVLYVL